MCWSSGYLLFSSGFRRVGPAACQREEHVIEVGRVNREIDDVDTGLIEVAQNATEGGDVAVGGNLQAHRVVVGVRHSQRVGGHELRIGVRELDVDATAGDLMLELLRGALRDQTSA